MYWVCIPFHPMVHHWSYQLITSFQRRCYQGIPFCHVDGGVPRAPGIDKGMWATWRWSPWGSSANFSGEPVARWSRTGHRGTVLCRWTAFPMVVKWQTHYGCEMPEMPRAYFSGKKTWISEEKDLKKANKHFEKAKTSTPDNDLLFYDVFGLFFGFSMVFLNLQCYQ